MNVIFMMKRHTYFISSNTNGRDRTINVGTGSTSRYLSAKQMYRLTSFSHSLPFVSTTYSPPLPPPLLLPLTLSSIFTTPPGRFHLEACWRPRPRRHRDRSRLSGKGRCSQVCGCSWDSSAPRPSNRVGCPLDDRGAATGPTASSYSSNRSSEAPPQIPI